MAIQILPGQSRTAMLGSALGTGLGQGLQSLLQDKMNRMLQAKQQAQTTMGLESLGIPTQQATQISQLPPELQSAVVKNYLAGAEAMGLERTLARFRGVPEVTEEVPLERRPEPTELERMPEDVTFPQTVTQQRMLESLVGARPERIKEAVPAEREPITFEEILKRPRLKPEHRLRIEQMAQQERLAEKKISVGEKKLAFGETKTYRDQTDTASKHARSDLQNLKMQEDLIKTGKLIGPRASVFLDIAGNFLGLDESGKTAFKNAESTVFEKLSIPYFRGLKEKFGSRPTQWDAQQLQKSFPSLYQTTAGKKVIIEFMKHDAMSAIKEKQIKDNVIAENKDIPPLNLNAQVDDRLSKWKDKEYLKLRVKASEALVEESGPTISARDAGKGRMVKDKKSDIIYISDGKKWKMKFS